MSDWIQTFTGKLFYPMDPKPEDVCIEDIAHALSLKCRFGGMCREFYSVAEHCCRVADIVAPESKLLALLHDAAEAYLPDVAGPIKGNVAFWEPDMARNLTDTPRNCPSLLPIAIAREHLDFHTFAEREDLLHVAICHTLMGGGPGYRDLIPDDVKQADLILLMTEARDLMGKPPKPWKLRVPVLPDRITPISSGKAEALFLQTYRELLPKTLATGAGQGGGAEGDADGR